MDSSPFVRTRIHGGPGGRATRHHAGYLTPYLAQLMMEEVLRRGPGVRLEIAVGRGLDARGLCAIQERLAPLARKGIRVVIHRHVRRSGADPQPDAA